MRQRRDGHRFANDAAREEVGIAVVIQDHRLRRRGRGALEGDLLGERGLAPAMTGAQT